MMCADLLVIAWMIASGKVGSLSIGARIAISLVCAAAVFYTLFRTLAQGKIYEIHISGTGQIRLSVLQKNGRIGTLTDELGDVVRLLPVSTLWSGLLLLHLQNEQQKIAVVTILPDSVSRESFRALLVACRWIVMRHAEVDNQGADTN